MVNFGMLCSGVSNAWRLCQNLECMMINKWKRMCCMNNTIKVDNGSWRGGFHHHLAELPTCLCDHPVNHLHARTNALAHRGIQCHDGKESHMSNIETSYAARRWVCVDKDHVIMTRSISPRFHCMDTFTMHATNSQDVAWCMECCDSGRIDGYLAVKHGEVETSAECCLVVDKLPDEIGKVSLFYFSTAEGHCLMLWECLNHVSHAGLCSRILGMHILSAPSCLVCGLELLVGKSVQNIIRLGA